MTLTFEYILLKILIKFLEYYTGSKLCSYLDQHIDKMYGVNLLG